MGKSNAPMIGKSLVVGPNHAVLEDARVSRDGREFSLHSPYWQLNKDVKMAVAWSKKLQLDVSESYLEVLAYYAENYSADHAYNMNGRSCSYFDATGDTGFNVDSLISYRASLDKTTEHHLGALRGFIRKWYELGYPGVGDEIVDLLRDWRLRGNEKGRAVSLMDEDVGPLTDIEMAAFLDGMLAGYMRGDISLSDYALSSTLAHSGRRAVQIASLKIKDLIKHKQGDIWQYAINFPRAKQRGMGWRREFNSYPIVEDLWLLLDLQAKSVVELVQEYIDIEIGNATALELPLFPNMDTFQEGLKVTDLAEQLQFDLHHANRGSCNKALKRCVSAIDVRSERTGKALTLTSKRFRYTLGTNLAREGRGEYIIAEALDHTDTQNAGVYVRNIPDIVERIDKAVAMQLAPLAQAFQGVLVTSENEAIRGDDKASRISNGRNNVGNCGSYGFCGALAPIACYTCTHFQPWLDGPHEAVMDELIAKRDDVLAATNDAKIAAVNDRLILAVSDVIHRCRRAREKNPALEVSNG